MLGIGFNRATPPIFKVNLLESDYVIDFLTSHKPSVVVHCAAERRPDVAAKNEKSARALNVGVSELLATLRLLFLT